MDDDVLEIKNEDVMADDMVDSLVELSVGLDCPALTMRCPNPS